MSDDLIQRLRETFPLTDIPINPAGPEAADRIEALERRDFTHEVVPGLAQSVGERIAVQLAAVIAERDALKSQLESRPMEFQRLSNFDTDTLIHEMEVRGFWSIPKWNVKSLSTVEIMDERGLREWPKDYRDGCARNVATRMGHFLLETDAIKFREGRHDMYGATRELIGTVHIVTEMPRQLLRASLDAPLNSEGE